MSLPHKSVATIDNIQFVNLTPLDINPLMSKCEIKVFYVGENRNGSYIKKEVATDMAKTLRGAPIVGYYKQEKEDFADHGEKVIIDDEGFHFECMTRPYGFVSPDAQVWFKKFMEQDDFGNQVEREYLMTTGYLWTEQYPEAKSVFEDEGKPHSMELDNASLDGHWAKNPKDGMEFFIINDAIISKLCILGNDVEPCFEGSSITAPDISKTFTKTNDDFTKTLFSMMEDLKFALQGGNTVSDFNEQLAPNDENQTGEKFSSENQDNNVENQMTENQENTEDMSNTSDFANKDQEDKKEAETEDEAEDEDEEKKKYEVKQTDDSAESHVEPQKLASGEVGGHPDKEEEQEEEQEEESDTSQTVGPMSLHSDSEYTELENKYNDLQSEYTKLEKSYNELVEFKNQVEDVQKDELIAKFYMLPEEDKKDVIENKRNYTLDEIEEKLAVICFRKKVNFDLDNTTENQKNQTDKNVVTTFNMSNINESTPDWIKAVKETQKNL